MRVDEVVVRVFGFWSRQGKSVILVVFDIMGSKSILSQVGIIVRFRVWDGVGGFFFQEGRLQESRGYYLGYYFFEVAFLLGRRKQNQLGRQVRGKVGVDFVFYLLFRQEQFQREFGVINIRFGFELGLLSQSGGNRIVREGGRDDYKGGKNVQ